MKFSLRPFYSFGNREKVFVKPSPVRFVFATVPNILWLYTLCKRAFDRGGLWCKLVLDMSSWNILFNVEISTEQSKVTFFHFNKLYLILQYPKILKSIKKYLVGIVKTKKGFLNVHKYLPISREFHLYNCSTKIIISQKKKKWFLKFSRWLHTENKTLFVYFNSTK